MLGSVREKYFTSPFVFPNTFIFWLTYIDPSIDQTLNNSSFLGISFARFMIFFLYEVRFSFKKIPSACTRVDDEKTREDVRNSYICQLTSRPIQICFDLVVYEFYNNWFVTLPIQTGQYSPRKMIKRWNVTKSMGLALVNIFKTINECCPILWASVVPVKTHVHSLAVRSREK